MEYFNSLADLFVFVFIVYSLTFGFIESQLPFIAEFRRFLKKRFEKNKTVLYFLSCYHCLGFWFAAIVAVIFFLTVNPVKILALALLGAGTNVLIANVVNACFSTIKRKNSNGKKCNS